MTPPLVCIDPGHGGTDPGAVSGGVRESDVALAHALAIGAALEAAGVAVLYTRAEDASRTLASRARAANDAGAARFVSVHANASESSRAYGFQVFHCRGSEPGAELARRIYDAALPATGETDWSGVYPDESAACGYRPLYVLRATRMPAVLLELGFLTHPGERERLQDPAYRQLLAASVAAGILADLGLPAQCVPASS